MRGLIQRFLRTHASAGVLLRRSAARLLVRERFSPVAFRRMCMSSLDLQMLKKEYDDEEACCDYLDPRYGAELV